MSSETSLRIGTRGSPLALAQAAEVRRRLSAALRMPEERIEIVPIRTTGDAITDRPLTEAGGKGLFTREIDEALLSGVVDVAVHSAKDMPTAMPDGLMIAACLERADVRDAFVSPIATRLGDLPQGAILGTSSLRRKAMALRLRPDLQVIDLRGNVETRIRKLSEGIAHATLLAAAGLTRLGILDQAASFLSVQGWLPAPGQGAIAIMAREDDAETRGRLVAIDHRDTSAALRAERAYLAILDGSCRTPIGGLARIAAGTLTFRGMIIKPDGSESHEVTRHGPVTEAGEIGAEAGASLATHGGPDFFTAA